MILSRTSYQQELHKLSPLPKNGMFTCMVENTEFWSLLKLVLHSGADTHLLKKTQILGPDF